MAKPEENEMVGHHFNMILTFQVSKQLAYRLIFKSPSMETPSPKRDFAPYR